MQEHLGCNVCSSVVDGIAYRTSCYHFICPACAQQAFISGCRCPVCNSQSNIQELMVGMTSPLDSLDALFQILLQCPNWNEIMKCYKQLSVNMVDVSSFVNSQLALHANSRIESCKIMSEDIKKLKYDLENGEHHIQELQRVSEERYSALYNQYSNAEREIAELKEGYKDKMRKCQAWEKAYGALREQLLRGTKTGVTDGDGMTLPVDPLLMNSSFEPSPAPHVGYTTVPRATEMKWPTERSSNLQLSDGNEPHRTLHRRTEVTSISRMLPIPAPSNYRNVEGSSLSSEPKRFQPMLPSPSFVKNQSMGNNNVKGGLSSNWNDNEKSVGLLHYQQLDHNRQQPQKKPTAVAQQQQPPSSNQPPLFSKHWRQQKRQQSRAPSPVNNSSKSFRNFFE